MVYVVSHEFLQSVQQNELNSLKSVKWFWTEHRTEISVSSLQMCFVHVCVNSYM